MKVRALIVIFCSIAALIGFLLPPDPWQAIADAIRSYYTYN